MQALRGIWQGVVDELKEIDDVEIRSPESALDGALRIRLVPMPSRSGQDLSDSGCVCVEMDHDLKNGEDSFGGELQILWLRYLRLRAVEGIACMS